METRLGPLHTHTVRNEVELYTNPSNQQIAKIVEIARATCVKGGPFGFLVKEVVHSKTYCRMGQTPVFIFDRETREGNISFVPMELVVFSILFVYRAHLS